MIFVSWHKTKCIKQYENETSACKETIMDNTILSLFEKRLRDLPDSVCVLDEMRKLTARKTSGNYIWNPPTARSNFTANSVFPIYKVL